VTQNQCIHQWSVMSVDGVTSFLVALQRLKVPGKNKMDISKADSQHTYRYICRPYW
jgi:hypothetical protein